MNMPSTVTEAFGNWKANQNHHRRLFWQSLTVCLVWVSLVKLPATTYRDSIPQSWEAVLSFGAAHHLQWGKDIVFTYGPLAFLINDYYWGDFFLPVLLWSFGFAAVMTTVVLHFARRLPGALRGATYAALLLFTTPLSQDLGFDSIYFLSITLLGIACLPGEQPGLSRPISTGIIFGVLTLVKFTFGLYCIFTLLTLFIVNWLAGKARTPMVLTGTYLGSLIATSWFCGQSFSSLLLHFVRSFQLAAAYSSGMTLPAAYSDLLPALATLFCLVILIFFFWFSSRTCWRETATVAIVTAGAFLGWKEGFVRPDKHVNVFLVYSFLLVTLLPALIAFGPETASSGLNTASGTTTRPTPGKALLSRISQALSGWKFHPPALSFFSNLRLRSCSVPAFGEATIPRSINVLIAATLLFAIMPFGLQRRDFPAAIWTGFVPRMSETATALVAPLSFKRQLESQLESMRRPVFLPRIHAAVSNARVGVLSYDQHVAILNGLNFTPHPVFQSYAAYTHELQQLNANFFQSAQAPDYVIWRSDSVDAHFPTLENGWVLLEMLSGYSPIFDEQGFTLWKRNRGEGGLCRLAGERELNVPFNHWITLSNEPIWLRIELRRTFFGSLQNLLWTSSEARIEVELDQGEKIRYRLTPGHAQAGFVINPYLPTETSLAAFVSGQATPHPVRAFRIYTLNERFYAPSIRVIQQTIQGVPALQGGWDASSSPNVSQRTP